MDILKLLEPQLFIIFIVIPFTVGMYILIKILLKAINKVNDKVEEKIDGLFNKKDED